MKSLIESGLKLVGFLKFFKIFSEFFYSKNCIIFGFGDCFLVFNVKSVGVTLYG